MKARVIMLGTLLLAMAPLHAADIKVDLSKEQAGKPPVTFEPIVGTWLVVQDGPDKAIMVDGRPWVASKDTPTKLLVESARRLYGTNNEELMDNAKQFAYYPVAVLKGVDSFSNGTLSMKFKTIAGDADRCSGILFNVKPNGDWLSVRYNDTENNVALWEFHNGIRRNLRFSDRAHKFTPDRATWHELKLTIDGASLKAYLDGELALEQIPRQRAEPRTRRRRAEPGSRPREQRGAPSAGGRQGRPLGENRYHQLLQRLRRQPQVRINVLRTVIVLLLASAVPALAQSPNTSALVVTVVDQSGATVPGAQVSALNLADGGAREATSDAQGAVTLPSLSISGAYTGDGVEGRLHDGDG